MHFLAALLGDPDPGYFLLRGLLNYRNFNFLRLNISPSHVPQICLVEPQGHSGIGKILNMIIQDTNFVGKNLTIIH